jgi:hypothetical protein
VLSSSMWETTFPRLTHAGLGKPINEYSILLSMHDSALSPCPIRRGSVAEMLFPTWVIMRSIIILWVRQTHRHAVIMLSSSCEFDRHIDMLSSWFASRVQCGDQKQVALSLSFRPRGKHVWKSR